jgi:hypothetical protein
MKGLCEPLDRRRRDASALIIAGRRAAGIWWAEKAPSALAAFGCRETTATSPAPHEFQRQPIAHHRWCQVSGLVFEMEHEVQDLREDEAEISVSI